MPNLEIRVMALKELLKGSKARGVITQEIREIVNAYSVGRDFVQHRVGKFIKAYRSEIDNSIQPYAVFIPKSYDPRKPYPLLVNLHGKWGSTTKETFAIAYSQNTKPADDKFNIIRVWVFGRGNTSYHLLGENDVFRVMEEVKRDYNIDEKRVYLIGGSMGGHGTWFISVYHPDRFAAISPICGYCDYRSEEWSKDIEEWALPDAMTYYGLVLFAENYLHVPNFIHHGDKDKSVSVEHSRSMSRRLQELGYQVRYKEWPGVGHAVPVREKEVIPWLMHYTLDKYPKRVVYKTNTLRYNHAYWVTIDQFIEANTVAKMEAEAKEGNMVSVSTENIQQFSLDLGPQLFDNSLPVKLSIDNSPEVVINPRLPGRITVRKGLSLGQWSDFTGKQLSGLHKRHGLQGTLLDVYASRFIYVYGSIGEEKETEINKRVALAERDSVTGSGSGQMVGDFEVRKDQDVSEKDIATANLILIGRPSSNSVTKRIASELPIRIEGGQVCAQGRHGSDDLLVRFIYPNPLNPDKYVVVHYALNPDKLCARWGTGWELPDYMIFRMTKDEKGEDEEEYLEAGLFDGSWQLPR